MIGVAVYLTVVVAYSALMCGHQGADWPPGWMWRRWQARWGRERAQGRTGGPNSWRRQPGRVGVLTEPHSASCGRETGAEVVSGPHSPAAVTDPPAPQPDTHKPADARTDTQETPLPANLNPTDGPIHTWFELSYCNYQVLHRTLMQSMPVEWQERMVACLEELRAAFDHVEQPEGFKVEAATTHIVNEMTDAELAEAGIEVDWYAGETPPKELSDAELAEWRAQYEQDQPAYYGIGDGDEVDPHWRVLLPAPDPVPHYNRGRTYIEPRICTRCKGSGVDPEHADSENYGDIVRELPVPCQACQSVTTPA